MRAKTFKVYRDKKGEWRFQLVSSNGKIICSGEGYKRRADCVKTIQSIIRTIHENSRLVYK
jgi:uncharacterized protein YegP (UPF0339 family)